MLFAQLIGINHMYNNFFDRTVNPLVQKSVSSPILDVYVTFTKPLNQEDITHRYQCRPRTHPSSWHSLGDLARKCRRKDWVNAKHLTRIHHSEDGLPRRLLLGSLIISLLPSHLCGRSFSTNTKLEETAFRIVRVWEELSGRLFWQERRSECTSSRVQFILEFIGRVVLLGLGWESSGRNCVMFNLICALVREKSGARYVSTIESARVTVNDTKSKIAEFTTQFCQNILTKLYLEDDYSKHS